MVILQKKTKKRAQNFLLGPFKRVNRLIRKILKHAAKGREGCENRRRYSQERTYRLNIDTLLQAIR